jgi:hypothetical protein
VLDFLEYLDLSPDQGFQLSPQMHNSSLDVQAAQLLHVYDSVSDDTPGRETLVEDLLMLIDRHGGGDRQFLDDKAIRLITEHYAESNRMLRTQYGVDLTVDKTRANSTSPRHSKVTPGQYVSELAALSRFPRWNGGDLAALALEDLLKRTRGWSRPTERGCWSSGRSSLISFRVPHAHRALGHDQPLSISFKGHYFADIRETQLWSNGVRLGDFDLRDCVILLPSDQPDADGVIELELKHAAPVSPASLGKSPDERQLAYHLEAIQFTVPI